MEQEKKYLKTIEEVSDALAAGKVVYFDNDRQDTLKKDKNGVILLENKYEKRVCVGCFLGIEDKPYILEPKPLEVKLWHLYEDEGGRKILVCEKQKTIYPFVGLNLNTSCCYHYNDEGKSIEPVISSKLVKELADLSEYFK